MGSLSVSGDSCAYWPGASGHQGRRVGHGEIVFDQDLGAVRADQKQIASLAYEIGVEQKGAMGHHQGPGRPGVDYRDCVCRAGRTVVPRQHG
jgi:hypothetical protein